jgi:hypothetical protein
MRKIATTVSAAFLFLLFGTSIAKADVVVEGKAKVTQSGGNTYVKCRKRGECIRITAGTITTYHGVVTLEDDTTVEYDFNSYDIQPNDVEGGYDVTLYK